MITLIPALDIMEGKCVRLQKGDFSRKTHYSDDPLQLARAYEEAGFKRLHLVDLDGARTGRIKNLAVLESLCSGTGLCIDFGGGIKTTEDLSSVFDAGAEMVSLGSMAVKNPLLLEEWIAGFGASRFILGADVKDKQILISGWQDQTSLNLFDFVSFWLGKGIRTVMCTDIEKDGMMEGSSLDLYEELMQAFPDLYLIASGGLSRKEEIVRLNEMGVGGVVIGKALLDGSLSVASLQEFITE